MTPFFLVRPEYARHNRVADNTSFDSIILPARERSLQSYASARVGGFPSRARIIR